MRLKFTVILLLALCLTVLPAVAAGEQDTSPQASKLQKEAKYPPYPDVWDWQIPEVDKLSEDLAIEKITAMDNGDVMITYRIGLRDSVVKYVTFFGKTVLSDMEAKAVYKENYTGDAKSRIPFRGNLFLKGGGAGMRSGGCYDALGFGISIYDKTESRYLTGKMLLYVFDKPKYYETHHPHCMDGPSFYYQVEAVDPKFLPLKDGTFLLVASQGYIIRFDENFQTKSKLMNNKFFWMDDEDFGKFEAKYGDRAVGDKDLKRLYADLYKLLMNKKRRESK